MFLMSSSLNKRISAVGFHQYLKDWKYIHTIFQNEIPADLQMAQAIKFVSVMSKNIQGTDYLETCLDQQHQCKIFCNCHLHGWPSHIYDSESDLLGTSHKIAFQAKISKVWQAHSNYILTWNQFMVSWYLLFASDSTFRLWLAPTLFMCPVCLLSVVFISTFMMTHVRGHSLTEGKKWECLSHSDLNVSLNAHSDLKFEIFFAGKWLTFSKLLSNHHV